MVTIVGTIIFSGLRGFLVRGVTEYYLYSLAVSIFAINSRYGKLNLGIIPALLFSLITTFLLKSSQQYNTVPLPLILLPLLILFTGLNYITGYFFRIGGSHTAKALLFGICAALFRTMMFLVIQIFFKNLEMFNFLYYFQQGLQLFLTIGVGISLAGWVYSLKRKEEVDIVEKVIREMKEEE
jgi:hypothetical protein